MIATPAALKHMNGGGRIIIADRLDAWASA